MPFVLTSADGLHSFEICELGARVVVGRGLGSDIAVPDATISRRHASLECHPLGLHLVDLGSSNGTFHNGARIESAEVVPGDEIAFGRVRFHVAVAPARTAERPGPGADQSRTPLAMPAPTVVRERPVRGAGARDEVPGVGDVESLTARKLALLLEVSTGLARAIETDAILQRIAAYLFDVLDVDRAAILLSSEDGTLVPRISRDRQGDEAHHAVPRSIARRVVADRVAVLTDNAPDDTRFGGDSIVLQRVRSAMCAPLLGAEHTVLGVLYVDNLTSPARFGDDDLEFLAAFSGIAAAALEHSRLAERWRHEALVRSRFERYFAPALAERIARQADAGRLGGEKRRVAVLFSDIRGFTALAGRMAPGDVAALLTTYFTAMVECVFRHGGTLDKFIGDALLAQWGAPIGAPDDAGRAVAAALDMLDALDALNARWRAEGRPEIQVGIGLNAGDVFAGNIGSDRRMEFTIIGDAVNVASRLCAEAGPGEILLTGDLVAELDAPPPLCDHAVLDLRGRSQPVSVYRVERP